MISSICSVHSCSYKWCVVLILHPQGCQEVAIISHLVSLGHSNWRPDFRTLKTSAVADICSCSCFVSWPVWVIQGVCYLGSPSCILPHREPNFFVAPCYHWIYTHAIKHAHTLTCVITEKHTVQYASMSRQMEAVNPWANVRHMQIKARTCMCTVAQIWMFGTREECWSPARIQTAASPWIRDFNGLSITRTWPLTLGLSALCFLTLLLPLAWWWRDIPSSNADSWISLLFSERERDRLHCIYNEWR